MEKDSMKQVDIRIEIDPSLSGSEVIIRTDKRTGLTDQIVQAIEKCVENEHSQIPAMNGGTMFLLSQQEIVRVYTENRRVIVDSEAGVYESRLSLRKLEEMLDPASFVRISRFEIINLNRVSGFDFSIGGTVQVHFDNASSTWVSRRYVHVIQQTLGRWTTQRRDEQ